MRRTVANVAVGMVAGALLVGGPVYAMASEGEESHEHSSHMRETMSDPEMREEMQSFMSDMMSDRELREQMQSMMSEAMNGMSMMDDNAMSMMDR
jgi:hypothetical protein